MRLFSLSAVPTRLSRVLDHPGRFGDITWWATIVSVAGLIFLALQPLAHRLRVLSGLLTVSLDFPTPVPSRAVVAWRFSDPVALRRMLDDANRREWTPENQTNRAVLASTLGVLEQRRRQSVVVFRVDDREVSAAVVESDIPGYLQLAKGGGDSRRRLLAIAAGMGAAALLATAALARLVEDGRIAERGIVGIVGIDTVDARTAPDPAVERHSDERHSDERCHRSTDRHRTRPGSVGASRGGGE